MYSWCFSILSPVCQPFSPAIAHLLPLASPPDVSCFPLISCLYILSHAVSVWLLCCFSSHFSALPVIFIPCKVLKCFLRFLGSLFFLFWFLGRSWQHLICFTSLLILLYPWNVSVFFPCSLSYILTASLCSYMSHAILTYFSARPPHYVPQLECFPLNVYNLFISPKLTLKNTGDILLQTLLQINLFTNELRCHHANL